MHVGMSALLAEHDNLDTARQHLLTSTELGELAVLPQNRHRWSVAMARVRQAEGDPRAALELLDEAERLYVAGYSPNVRPVAAVKARVRLAAGELAEALGWMRERRLSADDDLSSWRGQLTAARFCTPTAAVRGPDEYLGAAPVDHAFAINTRSQAVTLRGKTPRLRRSGQSRCPQLRAPACLSPCPPGAPSR